MICVACCGWTFHFDLLSRLFRLALFHPHLGFQAKRYGYDILETNASDARSQKLLHTAMDGVTDSTVISGLFGDQVGGIHGSSAGKRLIIMDG